MSYFKQRLVEEEPQLPKRGEEILVWNSESQEPQKRIYVCYIEGATEPINTVAYGDEVKFRNGLPFSVYAWKYWKPISQTKEYTHKELEEKLGEKFIYVNKNK